MHNRSGAQGKWQLAQHESGFCSADQVAYQACMQRRRRRSDRRWRGRECEGGGGEADGGGGGLGGGTGDGGDGGSLHRRGRGRRWRRSSEQRPLPRLTKRFALSISSIRAQQIDEKKAHSRCRAGCCPPMHGAFIGLTSARLDELLANVSFYRVHVGVRSRYAAPWRSSRSSAREGVATA